MNERDIATTSTKPTVTEPPKRRVTRIMHLHQIHSYNPPQYRAMFEALSQVDEMSPEQAKELPGTLVVSTAIEIGDRARTVPVSYESSEEYSRSGLIEDNGRLVLVRGDLNEALSVEPIIEGKVVPTEQKPLENPPTFSSGGQISSSGNISSSEIFKSSPWIPPTMSTDELEKAKQR